MAPWFSIIIPVYNIAPYLQRCVRSVLEQTFCDYELILVDDGSIDGSSQLCDQLALEDPRIRVCHQENKGLSGARNTGFRMACGKYIWWIDGDDWIPSHALSLLHANTMDGQTDVVKFSHFRVEKGDTRAVFTSQPQGMYTEMNEIWQMAFYAGGKYGLSACMHIYRRQLLQDSGITFVSERLVASEDYLFNLQVLFHAKSLCVVKEPLYYYEQHTGSLTQRYKPDLFEKYNRLFTALLEYCSQKGLFNRFEGKIAAFYLWHLIRGTCLPNEYCEAQGRPVEESRAKVRALLRNPAVKQAWQRCDLGGFSFRQKMLLFAMRLGFEPLFYRLYVVNPKKKKEERK